jgi:WD repeat and SOF domain-containing protein 1
MKVKTINRSEQAYTRERQADVLKVHRNLDPTLHPMEQAVEYTRALKAGTSPSHHIQHCQY